MRKIKPINHWHIHDRRATTTCVLVAAFDGAHGWFWRNRGNKIVTVTLRTNGAYEDLKRK